MAWRFSIRYFFQCFSEWIEVIFFVLRPFIPCYFFPIFRFSFSVMLSPFPYLAPKLFSLFFIRLLLWNILFCLYFLKSCLVIFLVFLLLPVFSDLFPQVELFVLIVVLFSSWHIPAFSFCLRIFDCCRFFLSVFRLFPSQVLNFCSCSFGLHRLFTD